MNIEGPRASGRRVAASDAQRVVGLHRARCPHLLAGDDPFLAVEHGLRLQTGEVGAGTRLRQELGPHLFTLDHRGDVAGDLLRVAEVEERRRADADGDGVARDDDTGGAGLLVERLLVVVAQPLAAVLGIQGDAEKPGVPERDAQLTGTRVGRAGSVL
jgi:hypothetical protein